MNYTRTAALMLIAMVSLAGCEKKPHKPAVRPRHAPAHARNEAAAPTPTAAPAHASTGEAEFEQVITGRDGTQMVFVPAGVFVMGTNEGKPEEGPRMSVFIEEFYIDRFEISNEKFAAFVKDSGYKPLGKFSFPAGKEQYPARGLNWYDAKAYCEWAGKRLPIEYEWEKAARGQDGRLWPWGNEEKSPGPDPNGQGFKTLHEFTDPTGQSPYGCLHMADNVWEWVDDWFGPYIMNTMEDPRFGETYKVIRGGLGSGAKGLTYSRTTARRYLAPEARDNSVGARCAMDAVKRP